MALAGEDPHFRVWTYPSPAIVLGCSQRSLRGDAELLLNGRAALVERESGGGAVLTGPWLVSASVVLPHGHPWVCDGLMDGYRRIGQVHARALNEFGIAGRLILPDELVGVPRESAVRPVDWACFGSLSPWEVVNAEGRKLVGLAQKRCRTGILLVAGTLINNVDWSLLCDVMGRPEHEAILRECTVSVEEIIGHRIEPEQFAGDLMRWLERALLAGDDGQQNLS